MTYLAEHAVPGPFLPSSSVKPSVRQDGPIQCSDERWHSLTSALKALRSAGRSCVRIVDCECESGSLLLCAARYARQLGFTSVEARGVDLREDRIRRARARAMRLRDPGICIGFEAGNMADVLNEEREFPADILVWHGCPQFAGMPDDEIATAAASGSRTQIADPAFSKRKR